MAQEWSRRASACSSRRVEVKITARASQDQVWLQAMMSEITALELAMRELLLSADKGIGAAGALIVTGLSLALTEKALYIVIALPYALTAVFFFMLQKYIEREMRWGIRMYLEEMINERLGRRDIFQQSKVMGIIPRPDEQGAGAVYSAAAVLVISASFLAIRNYQPPEALRFLRNIWWLHLFGLALCGYVIRVADSRMRSARKEAYRMAKAANTGKAVP
jgi:hypothetical protein